MIRLGAIILVMCCAQAHADSVVATRLIRAQTVLALQDIALVTAEIPGAVTEVALVIGQEARVTLYPGRAIRLSDIGAPALVDRNQVVLLTYSAGGLGIVTEGRALGRGGVGDMVRVMNLASRNTVFGRVSADGTVAVGSAP